MKIIKFSMVLLFLCFLTGNLQVNAKEDSNQDIASVNPMPLKKEFRSDGITRIAQPIGTSIDKIWRRVRQPSGFLVEMKEEHVT